MGDALSGAGETEAQASARLAETARQVASTTLVPTAVAASRAIIRATQGDGNGATDPAAAARELRRLRTDPGLMQAIDRDLDLAERQAALLIGDALWVGYTTAAKTRSAAMSTDRLQVSYQPSETDRSDLIGYPILGLTALEWAESLRRKLGEVVDQTLALPLVGAIDASAIPASLAAAGADHAQRVSSMVAESFQAGVQAATRALGAAITGAFRAH